MIWTRLNSGDTNLIASHGNTPLIYSINGNNGSTIISNGGRHTSEALHLVKGDYLEIYTAPEYGGTKLGFGFFPIDVPFGRDNIYSSKLVSRVSLMQQLGETSPGDNYLYNTRPQFDIMIDGSCQLSTRYGVGPSNFNTYGSTLFNFKCGQIYSDAWQFIESESYFAGLFEEATETAASNCVVNIYWEVKHRGIVNGDIKLKNSFRYDTFVLINLLNEPIFSQFSDRDTRLQYLALALVQTPLPILRIGPLHFNCLISDLYCGGGIDGLYYYGEGF